MTIVLVSCSRRKNSFACAAKDLYCSLLFRLSRQYAEREGDHWYILSAKYGLLYPEWTIAPYDKTLAGMSSGERDAWTIRVRRQLELCELPIRQSTFVFLTGVLYQKGIDSWLEGQGALVRKPLAGLSMGRRIQKLLELNRARRPTLFQG
jgi:hypothetical protein